VYVSYSWPESVGLEMRVLYAPYGDQEVQVEIVGSYAKMDRQVEIVGSHAKMARQVEIVGSHAKMDRHATTGTSLSGEMKNAYRISLVLQPV